MDVASTWKLIHSERAQMAETLAQLTPEQWASPSLCGGWTVQVAAGHIVVGAEQTPTRFFRRMAANRFRFDTMMDVDARALGALSPSEIIERLRARLNTTNRPPAPVMAMLGEIVVHGQDIRRPLHLDEEPNPEAVLACLQMFARANFPVGAKRRIAGTQLSSSDITWNYGTGPKVSGPALSLLMAITGRAIGLDGLEGDGVAVLRSRLS